MKNEETKKIIGIAAAVIVVICLIFVGIKAGKKSSQNEQKDNVTQTGQDSINQQNVTKESSDKEDEDSQNQKQDAEERVQELAKSVDEHMKLLEESASLASNGLPANDVKQLVEQVKENLEGFEKQLEEVEDDSVTEAKKLTSEYLTEAKDICNQLIDALEKDSDKKIKNVQKHMKELDGRLEVIEKAGK